MSFIFALNLLALFFSVFVAGCMVGAAFSKENTKLRDSSPILARVASTVNEHLAK